METTSKRRTPSRCREWERQRRNKFNEAISKLGEVVKTIIKANEPSDDEIEDVQYPKIEIIQKAIICLTNCSQEKTRLKAEILALQVKLDDYDNRKPKMIDASTQVLIAINKKNQSSKYVKKRKLQKSKRNVLKEKPNLTNVTNKQIKPLSPLKLFPKSNLNGDKKGPENTIVVLPAAPYIFPQRPLLFPAVPPAFVIVDSNLQPLNKSSVPIVNRNNGDITKTTMVNILPISAYSHPLSAIDLTISKKNNVKSRNDVAKKHVKKTNTTPSSVKEANMGKNLKEVKNLKKSNKIVVDDKVTDQNENTEAKKVSENITNKNNIQTSNSPELSNSNKEITTNSKDKPKESESLSKVIETSKLASETTPTTKATDLTSLTTFEKTTSVVQNSNGTDKFTKVASEIETLTEDKDKENKLPNILDSTLCDNVVDTGNARLELAEEFLAASPTAAFLMSFPLVSGNRADSPAEEPQNTVQGSIKDNSQRRNDTTTQPVTFFEKVNTTDTKIKPINKPQATSNILNKHSDQQKYNAENSNSKEVHVPCKTTAAGNLNVTHENPFLNLPMPSLISTNCTMADSTFGLDFDCNINKSIPNQSSSYVSNNNIFYKGDPFSTVKSTIYSTSSISSGHEFNSLGLYPCAMEKYTSKNKSDYTNVEDNLMKIGSSRLTYDIDLGWSHKGFDFVNCTTSTNTFSKDILTTVSAPYSNSYNPFNPDFQLPMVSSSNKKDTILSKPNPSLTDTITSFYSQPTNIWTDDMPFYTNNNGSKSLNIKHQNYLPPENMQNNTNLKSSNKHYETKQIADIAVESGVKPPNMSLTQQTPEKYTKKSPSKMHINWMTSEIRPMGNHCISNHTDPKENLKSSYGQLDPSQITKKQDVNESNYFPISMHNFPAQAALEELQIWPSARTVGPTEISIDPPPINLPTLVGDLALGPHDKKKNSELASRVIPQTDIQNCSNFLSVTQLMNRSSDNIPSRYQAPNIDPPKTATKQSTTHFSNESTRKPMSSRLDSQLQSCYNFNDSKTINPYDSMGHFSQNKPKTNKSDKSSKSQKNSYSAEALIRGGCTQKNQDSTTVKFMMPSQKYNNFNTPQENSIAQVSHFPPILDYTDNSYSQQFSGTTLYNTTTNTISNSFYSNFMPGSSNLMSGNYASGHFPGEFMDYNQTPECNYANHKYEELKMRNNSAVFQQQDKVPSSYKSSRRESAAKHKLECSKKDSNKKYQSKRAKLNNEVDEWNDPSHSLWQNKPPNKRHSNLVTDELSFPNYVGNQVPTQYQTEFFNSHLMPSSMQSVGHNVDRSLASLPVTSRANFNLSSIFPEITMKVQ